MKRKIVGLFVMMLWFGITVLPATGDINMIIKQDINNTSLLSISGINFYQVDYQWTYSTYINSDTGLIVVNIDELNAATGLESGYVNVYTSQGWIVENLVIIQDSTTNIFPYPTVGTYFNLGQSGDVKSIGAYIEYTAEPYLEFVYSAALPPYPVYDTELNAEGGEDAMVRRAEPPDVETLPGPGGNFNPFGQNTHCVQKEHPNIECAKNQCVPAAYANNLQYLENWYGTYIQHVNIPGLGGDNSLVGNLDIYMDRSFVNRSVGSYTGYTDSIEGLVEYTYKASVTGIEIRHQGWEGDKNIQYEDEVGYISYGQGLDVKFDFIYEEICAGSAVELAYKKETGGGHMVQIVAAGYILDVPYIYYLDDRVQIDLVHPDGDSKGTQPPQPHHRYLVDIDNDGLYNLLADPEDTYGPAEIVCIYVQQSMNSPPKKPSRPSGGGLIMEKNVEYEFFTKTTDPDDNQIFYQWSWGDNIVFLWDGPYPSGVTVSNSHSWEQDGLYEVKVRAKDMFGAMSEWSDPRPCLIPKSNIYDKNLFVQFLENHPHLFPLLRQILGL